VKDIYKVGEIEERISKTSDFKSSQCEPYTIFEINMCVECYHPLPQFGRYKYLSSSTPFLVWEPPGHSL
jgi:hypothetical protein